MWSFKLHTPINSTLMRYMAFQEERWDQIAYKVFGDPWKVLEVLGANRIEPKLLMSGGEIIKVPETSSEKPDQPAEVPPWLS